MTDVSPDRLSLEQFNALPETGASGLLAQCLNAPRWIAEILDGRPYDDRRSLFTVADATARILTCDELAAALDGHPPIGEHSVEGRHAGAAMQDKAGVDHTDAPDVTARLEAGRAAYAERFDRVFLIRASGRTAEEILAELERRLTNDDETERGEVVDNLRQIALLRLQLIV